MRVSARFILVPILSGGDGTFDPAQNHDTEQRSAAIAAGDFNGDAIPDVVVTRGQGGDDRHNSVLVFLGNGDGTFQPPNRFPGGSHNPFQLVVIDPNRDGKQDLVIGDALANSLSVLLGDGDGRFEPAVTFATGNNPNSIGHWRLQPRRQADLDTANIPTDIGTYSISVLINDTS
jgi:FG-GAP-like repeat